MKPAVIESMCRIEMRSGRVLRIWRDRTYESLAAGYDDDDLRTIARQYEQVHLVDWTGLLRALSEARCVNAVELVDGNGNGVVVYPEWP